MFRRSVFIGKDIWQYTVGDTNLIIRNPLDHRQYVRPLTEVTGKSAGQLEALQKTGSTDKVCPASQVKWFIERTFLRPARG